MSAQLDIIYKLKEALETGNPEVATPFMADDFTHQALPTQLGAPRRTRDQWKEYVVGINSRLKSLKFMDSLAMVKVAERQAKGKKV
ncbi:hypothetical protein BDM02DRAFT_3118358 [Thelephora ganbajun]|uniref:Uncharacterized protein n=1 Tax=Thelephora ganbajun TaxID=370292 RepID=A0ACB6ZAL7_THEGA|nr:hypothetical protein BDM02DRAFT_3118358 [Thelephora ganbajun]